MAREICERHGFEVNVVYYSGFWSQGDGAMFEGTTRHSYMKLLFITKMKKSFWFDKVFLTGGDIEHKGHYYHSGCADISRVRVYDSSQYETPRIDKLIDEYEEFIKEQYEDACSEIYSRLQKEYEYLTSDAEVMETIKANGYEFNENGTIA